VVDSVDYAGTAVTQGASRGVVNASVDNTDVGGSNWTVQTSTYGTQGNKGTPKAQNDGYVAPALSTGSVQGAVFLAPREQSMPRATRVGATDR